MKKLAFGAAAATIALVVVLPVAADTVSPFPVLGDSELQALIADNNLFSATDPNPSSRDLSVSFFVGNIGHLHPGMAYWTDATSNDTDAYSVELDVPEGGTPADGFSSFAGINFHHVTGQPAPASSPTFDFKPNKTSFSGAIPTGSGGSPRLVMVFSDGGNINLRPLGWIADQWVTEGVGATVLDWDNNGGICGFRYEQDYNTVVACHPGAVVTQAFIVSDSGWVSPPGGAPYTNWIDNIQYNGVTVSQPSNNS